MKCIESCYKLVKDSAHQWTLFDDENKKIKINFDLDQKNYRRKNSRGFKDPLLKAVGLGKGTHNVLDLSAGLGIDSVFFAQNGLKVTAVERHPLVYFLLQKALQQTTRKDLGPLEFIFSEAEDYLKQYSPEKWECIYFDPMYPEKKKSSLPRQQMQVFRQMIGADLDAEGVLKLALEQNCQRVVIKRPLHSEFLLRQPLQSIEGKTVRFDIYINSNK
ncbi:MAG: class I SAM-dependent methyltransferase [Pseudobdellovibrionaceae bacterium]